MLSRYTDDEDDSGADSMTETSHSQVNIIDFINTDVIETKLNDDSPPSRQEVLATGQLSPTPPSLSTLATPR